MSSYSERQRKRYAEDAEYRKAVQARNRAYRAAHKDELNARARKAYAEDDEYRARRRLTGNKCYRREERLKQVYGLSLQDYEAMVAQQGGVCRICKTKPVRPLFVDHCHASGRVRGLLCHPCNAALGFMRDDPVIAAAATEYLRDAKSSSPPGPFPDTRGRPLERSASLIPKAPKSCGGTVMPKGPKGEKRPADVRRHYPRLW